MPRRTPLLALPFLLCAGRASAEILPTHPLRDLVIKADAVVIAEPVRTPIGAFGGALKDTLAPTLGPAAIKAAVERAVAPMTSYMMSIMYAFV